MIKGEEIARLRDAVAHLGEQYPTWEVQRCLVDQFERVIKLIADERDRVAINGFGYEMQAS